MTDQKLRLVALQLATQATLNTGGTLEKAKEFYSWLSNEEGERGKEQEKDSSQFIISAREDSTLCDWVNYTEEQVRKAFKEVEEKACWAGTTSAASNPNNFVQPQTKESNPKGKSCGSMHYDEQIRLEAEEGRRTGKTTRLVDSLIQKLFEGEVINLQEMKAGEYFHIFQIIKNRLFTEHGIIESSLIEPSPKMLNIDFSMVKLYKNESKS